MIGFKFTTEMNTQAVKAAKDKGAFRSFSHGAASISKDAKSSLETAAGPSNAGEPPHTHKGALLRRAVRYAADKTGAVIGPVASMVGLAGEAHEFGKEFRGTDYPERPFMEPALERAAPRIADSWRGSISG